MFQVYFSYHKVLAVFCQSQFNTCWEILLKGSVLNQVHRQTTKAAHLQMHKNSYIGYTQVLCEFNTITNCLSLYGEQKWYAHDITSH